MCRTCRRQEEDTQLSRKEGLRHSSTTALSSGLPPLLTRVATHVWPTAVLYAPQAEGDVPLLTIVAETSAEVVTPSTAGSLQGVSPVSGTFALSYGGETTSPLYADASDGEEALLSLLCSIDR